MFALVIALVVAGFLLWLIERYAPLDPGVKRLIQIVVIVCCVVYVLNAFGACGYVRDMPVPQLGRRGR